MTYNHVRTRMYVSKDTKFRQSNDKMWDKTYKVRNIKQYITHSRFSFNGMFIITGKPTIFYWYGTLI